MNFLNRLIRIILSWLSQRQSTTSSTPTVTSPSEKPSSPPEPAAEPKPAWLAAPIPIDETMMSTSLRLGHYDEGVPQAELQALMQAYHRNMWGVPESVKTSRFRHGDLFEWVDVKPVAGQSVRALQTFLVNIGIMAPNSNRDGVFAYATQAGVRLFQEYVRIYEQAELTPTGIVDVATWRHIKAWQEQEKRANKWTRGQRSPEFNKWLRILEKAKAHYQLHSHPILDQVDQKVAELNAKLSPATVDTLPVKDWTFDPREIHLIGIRRKQETAGAARENDDAFILLINGMVFKFWGSTDPKATKHRHAGDEAFLAEGQHKFRFGWHNVSEKNKAKAYQGLNPFDKGVLVFRDWDDDNKLTESDIRRGVADEHNTTINIHWTGVGHRSTWSEGCQVIAGASYIDNLQQERDCSAFAAAGSADLQSNTEEKIRRTKGAYNVFTDLLLLYAPQHQDYLFYTLGRDETLTHDFLHDMGGEELIAAVVDTIGGRRG